MPTFPTLQRRTWLGAAALAISTLASTAALAKSFRVIPILPVILRRRGPSPCIQSKRESFSNRFGCFNYAA